MIPSDFEFRAPADTTVKPTFTQANADAGKLPKVGSEAQFFSEGYDDDWFDWCIFHGLATCGGYIIEHHHRTSPSMVTVTLFDPALTRFKPLPTERDIEIDDIYKIIRAHPKTKDAAIALHNAGYSKEVK